MPLSQRRQQHFLSPLFAVAMASVGGKGKVVTPETTYISHEEGHE